MQIVVRPHINKLDVQALKNEQGEMQNKQIRKIACKRITKKTLKKN